MQFWLKFICFIIASILIAHFIWNEMRIASLFISIITLIVFLSLSMCSKRKRRNRIAVLLDIEVTHWKGHQ